MSEILHKHIYEIFASRVTTAEDIPYYLFEFPEFIYDLEIMDSVKK